MSVDTDPALNALWNTFQRWDETAKYYRKLIDQWSSRTLWLAVAGAVLATLGQQLSWLGPKYPGLEVLFKAPGILGALCIALATYFTSQMLGSDRDKLWTRSRSAAESLRSLVYLYRLSVAPFSGTGRTSYLQTRIDAVLGQITDIQARVTDPETIPSSAPLDVDSYSKERLDDQIAWYGKRTKEFQTKADRLRTILLCLGVLSVLAAVFNVSVWAAVIATATTAMTAYVKNLRYQSLITLYLNTSTRLALLKSAWASSGKSDSDRTDRNAFIQRCEETMSLENGSWVAQWSEQQLGQAAAGIT